MPFPFLNAIKGTSSGTAGTGAFTPTTAPNGYLAWSTVPTGWIGLVRYDDGTSWELSYAYWNGTTLSRASTQLVSSSSGSAISLTSSATASMVADAAELMSHVGTTSWVGAFGQVNTTINSFRTGTVTETGTGANATIATTNMFSEWPRRQYTSATTANAQCGWSTAAVATSNTTAGRGGFEYTCRFAPSQLPTGPRLFCGMTSATFVGQTIEPSAFTAHVACFGLDSTDTNIQLLVNSNVSTGTKTTTGIPLVANGSYEAVIWMDPGAALVGGLLIRLDTGAIWYGTTTTDIPGTSTLLANAIGGLNGTNTGTAFIMQLSSMVVRGGI